MKNTLKNKIDFAVVFSVKSANPNGDPLNGNRPRVDYRNYGEVTDVAIKRKLRNRLMEDGKAILMQSEDNKLDDAGSVRERVEKVIDIKKDRGYIAKTACDTWFDVRAFGQVLGFSKKKGKGKGKDAEGDDPGVSIGVKGPVTLHSAFSVEPIEWSSQQITKSLNGEGDGSKRGSDTMGMKHRVDKGIYTFFGSMNAHLAERTGFTDEDAERIKLILPRMFENDESSGRPAGSMEILKVYWWQHNCKSGQYSSAKVHGSLTVNPDGTSSTIDLKDLKPEVIEGF